ncbi:MAG: BamA/TamA family outer membrane protein [Chitinophagaceae bacterium]
MLSGKPPFSRSIFFKVFPLIIIAAISSCTIVKKNQPGKAFVYKTNINLIGNFTNEQRQELVENLEGQLDDSLQPRKVDKLLWRVLKSPPVFDSTYADHSVMFMRALLNSLGYFTDSTYYTYQVKRFDTKNGNFFYRLFSSKNKPPQFRTIVDFHVRPGKLVRLDSISYVMRDTLLQQITDSSKRSAYIKKGDAFAKIPISVELDRLTELFRNNGYLRFTRDELVGLWDTLDVSLLQPTLDPFEQLELLQKLRLRRENPTANLEIRLRTLDSVKLTRFYMGNVTVYPDYTPDTIGRVGKETIVEGIKVIQYSRMFKPKIFPPNIYLPTDSIYRQRRYTRTINRLNLLGAWRLVSIDQVIRPNEDTVDFIIRLSPARKYSFSTNLEGSINQNAFSGNLFGIGVSAGIQNRNFARGANQANSNLRYGIELGGSGDNQFIQTQQLSFSHNIYFPRFIFFPGIDIIPANRRDNWRTLFLFNASRTQRRILYDLSTINGAWGYEFQRRNILLTFKIPNIEYAFLIKKDSLNKLIAQNPSLNNIFTDGFVSSVITNFTLSGGTAKSLNILRANVEESGLLTGMIHNSFLDTQLYRFIKMDIELAKLFRRPKSSIALRFFAGVGYEFDNTTNPLKRNSLPFFKQYYSGGPSSMRAWALRRLGPGSVVKPFLGPGSSPDRYGDMQLEGNVEYRFPIGRPFGIKINGAFFVDAGNIWLIKKAAGTPEEIFKFNRLGKDIAIGAGTGLRVDFDFFVIRFDYAYKVKDPSPSPEDAIWQNKWFGYPFFKGDQFQLGIGYPFIF